MKGKIIQYLNIYTQNTYKNTNTHTKCIQYERLHYTHHTDTLHNSINMDTHIETHTILSAYTAHSFLTMDTHTLLCLTTQKHICLHHTFNTDTVTSQLVQKTHINTTPQTHNCVHTHPNTKSLKQKCTRDTKKDDTHKHIQASTEPTTVHVLTHSYVHI